MSRHAIVVDAAMQPVGEYFALRPDAEAYFVRLGCKVLSPLEWLQALNLATKRAGGVQPSAEVIKRALGEVVL